MLLVFPPTAKPGEPPAGIAKLAGAVRQNGIPCELLDANLEGLLWLLQQPKTASDTWARRAMKQVSRNVDALRDPQTYRSRDRYARAVSDVNRVLALAGAGKGVVVGLADYQDERLSPVRSSDLLVAAEHPERNIFYPYFRKRLPEAIADSESAQHRAGPGQQQGEGSRPVIGFSLNYLSQALCTFAMIGFLRKEVPNARIVLGGGLITSWMKRPGWQNPFVGLVDHLIAGPGETALLKLFGVDASHGSLFTPEYGSLPVREYLSPGFVLPFSAAAGCYWNRCSFCPEPAEGNPYIPLSPDAVSAQLDILLAHTDPVMVHLLDNAVSPALLRALAETRRGVPWYAFARIGSDLADPDFCRSLKSSGCGMLKLGLESGDQQVLDRMKKGIDLGTASRVLQNLRAAGIATYAYLLFGTPAETEPAARRTLEFVVRHRAGITFLNLAVFNMPAGSAEAAQYETAPFSDGDLSLYTDFRHPAGWGRKQVRQFLESEFRRHPAVASILRNDPPVFTSNHAPFFVKGRTALDPPGGQHRSQGCGDGPKCS